MAKKKIFQYFILKGYGQSKFQFPEGIQVMYNFAMPSFDPSLQEQVFGYVEYDRELTKEEMHSHNLQPAEVDDSWL